MTPESITAAAKSAGKLSLPPLQSKMKCDPEGYDTELQMLYKQFNSSLELFHQQSALGFNSLTGIGADPAVAKDLSDRAMFLAHMTPVYPQHLSEFPRQLAELLKSTARLLPAFLRCHIAQALILLVNRKIVDIGETLALFMELQTLGDTTLRKLAFSHVVHCIRRLNKKHKNDAKNRPLQNILFGLLQRDEELIAKRSLVTLCELHRRRVWFDEKTANAICMACFHPSSRIMVAALSFLLDYEKIQDDDDSDVSSSDEEDATQQPQVVLSREAVYKAHRQGTTSSKKKKKAKLQRVMRSMKRQQRLNSQNADSNYYSPLNHLKDAQGFVEKLFSHLQSCNERFEVKMMMMKVIARTVGLHRLILLQFYPFLQKYVQPHQRDVTNLLAAVQACHDMVPPDAVEPLFKEVVNKFVHDRSRTEAIAVGINVVREICLRMPLLMTEELLQDLVLYKKSHEKAVSSAARSLITLFREVCPSLLVKKDRGRPVDPKARPKAFGDVNVVSNIPGAELLEEDNHEIDNSDIEGYSSEGDHDGDDVNDGASDDISMADCGSEDNEVESDGEGTEDEGASNSADDEGSADEVSADDLEDEDEEEQEVEEESSGSDESDERNEDYAEKPNSKKRVRSDFDELLNAAGKSLRALRKLTVAKMGPTTDSTDGILSNEDFRKIKELQAKKKVRTALEHHGLAKASGSKSASVKLPSSDDLSVKRVDPAKLEAHIRRKVTKDEKLALIRAGREERGKYQARTAVKKKKEGGLSNREKQRKKYMPDAAKRAKMAKTRQDKRRKHMRSGKQFRGKKAWKN